MTRRTTALILACAALAGGCGLKDPYASPEETPQAPATPTPTPTATATATPGPADEREALERFAVTWSNWTYPTLAKVREELAGQAVGDLRETLLRDARTAAEDASLRAGNSSNRGVVEGVLLRRGKPAIVVTREKATLGTGDGQEGYFVYLARVERTPDGWKVVAWDPV